MALKTKKEKVSPDKLRGVPRSKSNMNKLRITGGYLKGRNIALLDNGSARYTSSKVREAVFNILSNVRGLKILDLFAGSGSFTIEAMSRGASFATSVEKDQNMAILLQKNLSSLSIDKHCLVLNMDVKYAVPLLCRDMNKYDIIFMDPPYEKGLVTETMLFLKNNAVYDKNTIFIAEYSKKETIEPFAGKSFREITTRGYGDTVISIFKIDEL